MMTSAELEAFKPYVQDIAEGMGIRTPLCGISPEDDRIDIDTSCMAGWDIDKFTDRLAQQLGRKGWYVDVWAIRPNKVCVANKEEE